MTPATGSFCDLCTPALHYKLACSSCGHSWEEPCEPGGFTCPKCGTEVRVSPHEHAIWESANVPPSSRVSLNILDDDISTLRGA